jgi:UDP-N-acetyl-D-mannosaminuronate dehydrogenase
MNTRPKKKAYDILTEYKDKNNILICGLGFKKGESLLTNSPGYNLFKQLKDRKNIIVYDPYVENLYPYDDISFISKVDLQYALPAIDLVVVIHSYANDMFNEYQKIGGEVIWYTKP